MFLLNNSLDVLQNKHSSNWYIALVGISLKIVFLYKFELAKNAPNSVNTHLKSLNFILLNHECSAVWSMDRKQHSKEKVRKLNFVIAWLAIPIMGVSTKLLRLRIGCFTIPR